jgi:hypothetical protein
MNLEYAVLLISLLLLLYRRAKRRSRLVPNWVMILAHRKKAMKRSLDNSLPDNIIRFQSRSFRCALERTNSYTRIYTRDLAWYWSTKMMYYWLLCRCAPYRLAGKSHQEAGEIVMAKWGEAAERKHRRKVRREAKWKITTRR